MDCLTEEQIEMLASATTMEDVPPCWRSHLDLCAACRQKLLDGRANRKLADELVELFGAAGVPSITRNLLTADLTQTSADPVPTVSPASGEFGFPADLFPGYRILREIHRGGQGAVYQALQRSTQREVAIKAMLQGPLSSQQARLRFEREVRLIARFKHPGIVIVHDSGIVDGWRFFVMDYVRGSMLDDHVRNSKPDLRGIIKLFIQICDAVAYAHQRGVIHRDLKPSNILVNERGTPIILDFGLAKITDEEMFGDAGGAVTQSGHLLGTVAYMAPEQTLGNPDAIDVRTDVYALGVILYELIAGRPPYDTRTELGRVLRNIQEEEPSRLTSRESGIRRRGLIGELDAMIRKALEKQPERRYQSVSEFRVDLLAWIEGRPITAKSQSSLYVLRKLAVRHSFESCVIASLLIAILAFGGISFEYYQRERTAAADLQRANQIIQQKLTGLETSQQTLIAKADATLTEAALGWFLLEWGQGRMDQARRIRDLTAHKSKAYAAGMTFLLEGKPSVDHLRKDLAEESNGDALAYFLLGERFAGSGKHEEAREAYQVAMSCCRRRPAGQWLESAVRSRLDQAVLPSAGAHPLMLEHEMAGASQ